MYSLVNVVSKSLEKNGFFGLVFWNLLKDYQALLPPGLQLAAFVFQSLY